MIFCIKFRIHSILFNVSEPILPPQIIIATFLSSKNDFIFIISYNYEDRGTLETALKFLINKGIKYSSFSHDEKTKKYFIMTKDFETQIK